MPRQSYRVQFASGDGRHQLAGIVDRPEDSDAPVAVFSHCFTCNKDLKAIVRISRALSESGIAVLRYDMTGLGGSEGDFSDTHFTTNLADLRCAIGFAKEQLGPVCALIGHSFGGAASLAIAGMNEVDSLKSLITLAAPSDTKHLADLMLRMNPAIESSGQGEVEIGGRKWTITNQMLDDFRSHDLTKIIPNIQVPTTLIHSPADQTVAFDHALRILSLIRGSDSSASASLVCPPDADHLLTKQKDWEFVAKIIDASIHHSCAP